MNITILKEVYEGKRIAYNCWGGFPLTTMLKIILNQSGENIKTETKLLLITYIAEKDESREGMKDPNNLYLKFDYDYYDFDGDLKNPLIECKEFEENLKKIKNRQPFDFMNIEFKIKKNQQKMLRIGTAKQIIGYDLNILLDQLYDSLSEHLEKSKEILSRKHPDFDYLEIKY